MARQVLPWEETRTPVSVPFTVVKPSAPLRTSRQVAEALCGGVAWACAATAFASGMGAAGSAANACNDISPSSVVTARTALTRLTHVEKPWACCIPVPSLQRNRIDGEITVEQ